VTRFTWDEVFKLQHDPINDNCKKTSGNN